MKSLFQSIFTINKNLKKLISEEAINSFDHSLYQGDNANYCISLFQDYLNVGSYSKDWQPSQETSSGLYFVRLESLNNNLSISEKIMFVK